MKQTVGGKFGELFFDHEGYVVNEWLHYLPIYDALIPYVGSDVQTREIGVSRGGSLALQRKALGVRATMFGIDIAPQMCRSPPRGHS